MPGAVRVRLLAEHERHALGVLRQGKFKKFGILVSAGNGIVRFCQGGLDDAQLTKLLHALPTTLKSLEISAPSWRYAT